MGFESISHLCFIEKSHHFILECSHQQIWVAYYSKCLNLLTCLSKPVQLLITSDPKQFCPFINQSEPMCDLSHIRQPKNHYGYKSMLEFTRHLLTTVYCFRKNMIFCILHSHSHLRPSVKSKLL